MIFFSEWLTKKITREKLALFLSKQQTKNLTLNLGSKKAAYKYFFPNSFSLDVTYFPEIDIQGDGHSLPFKNKSFSTVVAVEVLEHCQKPHQVIDEIYRALKPRGRLILTTRFIFPLHETPYDYFRFTKYGLRVLLKRFRKIKISEEVGTLETFSVLLQRIAFQTQFRRSVPFINIGFHLLAKILRNFDCLIKKEYGNINRTKISGSIMTSGYYVIGEK